MQEIPITFEMNGREVKGYLSQVSGMGGTTYFLSYNRRHIGQLNFIDGSPGFENGLHAVPSGWRFTSNSHPELEALAEEFGSFVVSWLDSH